MTLRRIDAETLLTPPEPPKASIVMLGMSGYAVRISPKGGAQLVELLPDGACTRSTLRSTVAASATAHPEATATTLRRRHGARRPASTSTGSSTTNASTSRG